MIRSFALLIATLFWMNAQAEDSLSDPKFFNYLLTTGKSELAALEYERLQHEQSSIGANLSCELGDALLRSGNLDMAENTYENTLASADADSQVYKTAKLGIIRVYLLQRKPLLALNELNSENAVKGSAFEKDVVDFYKSAAYAASYAIDTSKLIIDSIPGNSRYINKAKRLDGLLTWYKSQGMKNPLYAYVYSSAVPGWGQWYIGDRKKAVTSFLLMTGLSGLLCYEGYRFYHGDSRERWVYGMDMFLTWGIAWRRYYNGIRKSAHQRVVEYNQHVQLEYQKRLRKIIED
jgi:hypothetical protein